MLGLWGLRTGFLLESTIIYKVVRSLHLKDVLYCESRSFFLLNIELECIWFLRVSWIFNQKWRDIIYLVLELGELLPPILQILAHYI